MRRSSISSFSSSSSSSSSSPPPPPSMAPSKSTTAKSHQNPSRPLPRFLYKIKIIIVFVLIALLPIFPSSQAPELPNKSILGRSRELLHLLLVGIAISYGLLSRRNSDHEMEKETPLKAETQQSYVSQIYSVFGDEEIQSPKGMDLADELKNQTWNYSQYYREEPVVMVAKEATNGPNINGTTPLFLPVRSLISAGSEKDGVEKIGGEESEVRPSPVPWRSRSGRAEAKQEPFPSAYSPPRSPLGTELSPSRTPSTFKSPPSPSQESKGKTDEDSGRKKSFHKYSLPPPPPPPPPPFSYSSHFVAEKREATRSIKDEIEDVKRREREGSLGNDDLGSDSFKSGKGPCTGGSVRTIGSKEARSLPPLRRNKSEKKDAFKKRMIITSDSESDDSESSDAEEPSNSVSPTMAVPEENEVDKKADEFIAKFREQIRLQRIATIKTSARQRSTRDSR